MSRTDVGQRLIQFVYAADGNSFLIEHRDGFDVQKHDEVIYQLFFVLRKVVVNKFLKGVSRWKGVQSPSHDERLKAI